MRAEHDGCMGESTWIPEAVGGLEPKWFRMVAIARDGDDLAVPRAVGAVQRVLVSEEGVGISCALSADLEQVGAALAGQEQSGTHDEPGLRDAEEIPAADVEDLANLR